MPPSYVARALRAAPAALAIPMIVIAAAALTRPWEPSSDWALLALRVHDVGGADTPLVGAYSRFGWNHPGPLLFWVLAVPYRLAGAQPVGLLAGTLAIHAAAIAGCIVLARRRGGSALVALVGLALALAVRAWGVSFLVEFWNPYLPVLVTAFLVLATWSVLEGDTAVLPFVVGASCFAWQSHLGYVPVTGFLTGVAIAGACAQAWRDRRRRTGAGAPADEERPTPARRRSHLWTAAATAITATVCLAPLVVDQLVNEPGNLRHIEASLRDAGEDTVGVPGAAGIVAAHLSPVGPWLTGDDSGVPPEGAAGRAHPLTLLVPFAAAAGAYVLARRVGAHDAAHLVLLSGACSGVAVVAVARTAGLPYFYLFAWLRSVSMVLWVSVAWAGVCAVRAANRREAAPSRRLIRLERSGAVALAVATVVASVASLPANSGIRLPDEAASRALQVVGPAAVAAAAGHARVRVAMGGGWCAHEIGHGVAAQLLRRGIDVVVPVPLANEYARRRTEGDVRPTIEVHCGPALGSHLAGSAVPALATTGVLSPADAAELEGLQQRFRDELHAAGHDELVSSVEAQAYKTLAHIDESGVVRFEPAALARFSELMERGRRAAAVFWWPDGMPEPVLPNPAAPAHM